MDSCGLGVETHTTLASPYGRAKLGAVELGGCSGKLTWAAGACPRPTKSTSLLLKLLSCNEPGDTQWCGFSARVTDSPLTAAARRPSQSPSVTALPEGEPSGVRFGSVYLFRDVSPFLIRLACGEPPSPPGEGFGAVQPWMCYGKLTWAAGACPRPTKGTFFFPKLLSSIEPGDTQWRGSTARVSGSN